LAAFPALLWPDLVAREEEGEDSERALENCCAKRQHRDAEEGIATFVSGMVNKFLLYITIFLPLAVVRL